MLARTHSIAASRWQVLPERFAPASFDLRNDPPCYWPYPFDHTGYVYHLMRERRHVVTCPSPACSGEKEPHHA